jgi:hypothetical protein
LGIKHVWNTKYNGKKGGVVIFSLKKNPYSTGVIEKSAEFKKTGSSKLAPL